MLRAQITKRKRRKRKDQPIKKDYIGVNGVARFLTSLYFLDSIRVEIHTRHRQVITYIVHTVGALFLSKIVNKYTRRLRCMSKCGNTVVVYRIHDLISLQRETR